MPTEYYIDDSITDAFTRVLQKEDIAEFTALRNSEAAFLIAAVRNCSTDGEPKPRKGPVLTIRRISGADAVFLPGFQFKVYVDSVRWEELNNLQKEATIHTALMRIEVVSNEDGVRYKSRRPDVEIFHETVLRYGTFEEPLIRMRKNLEQALLLAAKGETEEAEAV